MQQLLRCSFKFCDIQLHLAIFLRTLFSELLSQFMAAAPPQEAPWSRCMGLFRLLIRHAPRHTVAPVVLVLHDVVCHAGRHLC